MDYETIETDVLIIGGGAAGLRTAIELADGDVDVLVISNRSRDDAHTRLAAGGINAALGNRDPEDHWTIHAADTLREGHFISRPDAVELLARRSPDRVMELAAWGCEFAMTAEGKIDQRYFGAQSYRRTCFVGDRTGEAILETLLIRANELDIDHLDDISIVELTVVNGQTSGAIGFSRDTGAPLAVGAKAVVLASGGYTGLYNRHTSRHDENLGDSIGLAWRAGATIRDPEFVQFHPTGMVWPEEQKGTLVTEAVRGEGGRLFDADGHRFMEDHAPEEMELAPRDVVARAIAREIAEGNGTERGGVYLDISHRDVDFIRDRLPGIYEQFQQVGVDVSEEPMEVAPTAHYAMGGVEVEPTSGATGVDGLFAVGEAAVGVHGANRLGGNSLAETLVFGQLTGEKLVDWIDGRPHPGVEHGYVAPRLEHWTDKARRHGRHKPGELIGQLRKLLEEHAGIMRDGGSLRRGLDRLDAIEQAVNNLQTQTPPGSRAFERMRSLEHMVLSAHLILEAARRRQESRGAHFRTDYPDKESDWQVSITCHRGIDESPVFETHPVDDPSEQVQQALDSDHRLDYHHLE